MLLVRRHLLRVIGAAALFPAASRVVVAQAPQGAGPKLTQILRTDLQGQEQKVQETVVNLLEMGPGIGAPWHMHPGAQELLYVTEGDLIVEVDGQSTTVIKAGQIAIIPAEIPHLARNESANAMARALVVHSRADKEKPVTVVVKRST
jgi:quercetin dioxygenase-like cupin family protein